MSKLILHVGTHKTGTTTIQDTFALNRQFLAEEGLIFPQIGHENGQHGLVMDWIQLPEKYHLETSSEHAWLKLARDHAHSDRTVLISTEELSRANPSVDLRKLRDLISAFDEIKVVCCLRNQVSFLQSIYLQVVKSGAHVPWSNFFEVAVGTRMATGLLLDYSSLRSRFETGFQPHEIRFFSYERVVRTDGGIIGNMMDECGFGNLAGSIQMLPAGHSNVSPDPLSTWVAAHILQSRPFRPWLVNTAQETLEDIGRAGAKTTIFTKDEYRRLRNVFAPLNEAFNRQEAVLDTGMEIGAFPEEDNLTFRDALIPAYWVNLSRRLVSKI